MIKRTLASLVLSGALLGGLDACAFDYSGKEGPNNLKPEVRVLEKEDSFVEGLEKEVESVFRKRLVDAIRLSGLYGGCIKLPNNHYESEFNQIAYSYLEGKNTMPDRVELEKEISQYVRFLVYNNFSMRLHNNYLVLPQKPVVKTKIEKEFVSSTIKSPLKVFQGKSPVDFKDDFEIRIDTRFGDMLDTTERMVKNMIQKKDSLVYIPSRIGPYSIVPFSKEGDGNQIIYVITDFEKKVDGIPLSIITATKFGKERIHTTNVSLIEDDTHFERRIIFNDFINQFILENAFSKAGDLVPRMIKLTHEQENDPDVKNFLTKMKK